MADSGYVVVRPPAGALRGLTARTKGKAARYFRFLGIPYAAPPVGPLRFQPPKPAQTWKGVKDALKFGSRCVQLDLLNNEDVGSEDCLYLNVYTPKLPEGTRFDLLPVMFWIHGGGFTAGDGSDSLYGPDLLIECNVLVVTINYRLGAFGFLSTGDSVLPGNMGLKDQVMALQWVKRNIASFGGDPNNVTIFGESAGGASVHYLMLSPMAKGLFHKAIIQSGAAFCPWAFTNEPRKNALKLAASLGCNSTDSNDILSFLSKVPQKKIHENSMKLFSKEDMKYKFEVVFPPTVEKYASNSCFLPKHPLILSQNSKQEIPLLIGSTSKEGYIFMREAIQDTSILAKHFEATVEIMRNFSINHVSHDSLKDQIKKFYFSDKPISEEMLDQYADFQTDAYFGLGVHKAALFNAVNSSLPTYRYIFSYSGGINMGKVFSGASQMPGAGHADELAYLFNPGIYDLEVAPGSEDEKMQIKMTQLWTNFAKTGVPTTDLHSAVSTTCPPFTKNQLFYIDIDKNITVHKGPFKERMAFWEQIEKQLASKL
ncbi:esterase FE4-like [Schistocerca cancellata]|uniref:esterase FE4-like n=1 Tax=Schistocerca cancellata TaxID=274614 RepID=UPI002118D7C4|nr:esterase FE4-like [Schistocerca cancellata]